MTTFDPTEEQQDEIVEALQSLCLDMQQGATGEVDYTCQCFCASQDNVVKVFELLQELGVISTDADCFELCED